MRLRFRRRKGRFRRIKRRVSVALHGLTPAEAAFIASPAYLGTMAHKRWRYDVLDRYNARCACCGRTPQEQGIVVNADHVLPRKTHPHLALEPANGQILCGDDCNPGKGNRSERDWRKNPPRIRLSEEGARNLQFMLKDARKAGLIK